ncbi:hypothetical protein [uncultured Paludibaculum sp.]|uniref:mechanosensitive ion channel family protein n=1 Tax=uncultured Paludibaculum sp. TaxID=1765020 RepID=UPI002AABB449|nr:hypothetical protein [uncultured Paludibaculum sp.]
MIRTLQEVLERVIARFYDQITTYVPPLIVATAILVLAFVLAKFSQWLITRLFKGVAFDRFLRETGISSVVDDSGHLHGVPIAARCMFWLVFAGGVLSALSVFDTKLTTQFVETAVFLFPKVVTAAAIVLAGIWLGRYFGRGILVWAHNESLPHARRIAAGVRALVVCIGIVAASDTLGFAPNVFLAAFIIVVGGAALAASLAVGLGGRQTVERFIEEDQRHAAEPEEPLWRHL